ncbi:MAG: hypothetical protein HQL01_04680 [Nitrospirae bacterium]|nr:hypothetical protein [Nitrospirota bacterium]
MNYYSGVLWPSDSAIFVNVAHHMINGKILYSGAWDHKQPMVFVINALALKFGGETFNSVRLVERYFAIGAALAFFIISLRTFASSLLAAAFTIIFLVSFYDFRTGGTFDMGNFTEEYGAVFMLIGVACVLEAVRLENTVLSLVSGMFFSLSVFTKDSFLLSALPWVVYALLAMGRGDATHLQNNIRFRRFGYFAAGALIPLILALVYFIHKGIFQDWIDVFSHNLAMAHGRIVTNIPLSQTIGKRFHALTGFIMYIKTVNVFFILGVISMISKSFLRTYRYIPLVCVSWFVMGLIAVNVQGSYGHYYIQLIPAFIMVALCGAGFLVFNLRRISSRIPAGVLCFVLLVLSLLTLDKDVAKGSLKYLKYSSSTVSTEAVSDYIKEHTSGNDTIWVPSYDKYIYLQSGRLSPTKYLFLLGDVFLPTKSGTTEEKMRILRDDLVKTPPKFIFLETSGQLVWLIPVGIPEWFDNNYVLDSTWHNGDLYRHK